MHPNFIYFWLTRPLSAFQIACCPPGMQATTLDMVQAYRNSLIILAHKKYLVVSWNDGIYVQHNAIEGLCLASGIQGTPADACIEILCMNGIHPVFKWVNDFIIFHSPSLLPLPDDVPHYNYDLLSVFHITDQLGIPWHAVTKKGQDFA